MSREFVIFCEARTGSYSLVSRLSSRPDIICHAEIFKQKFIELHPWHFDRISVKSIEQRNRDPEHFISELRKLNPYEIFGFKFFNHHLDWAPRALEYIMKPTTRRIILIRDPVAVYASGQRALLNGVWTLPKDVDVPKETLHMKIRFTPENLMEFARHYNAFLRRSHALAANAGAFVIDHRQLDDSEVGNALLSYLGSTSQWPERDPTYRKQFEAPVEDGFENWSELQQYIERNKPFVELPPCSHPGRA